MVTEYDKHAIKKNLNKIFIFRCEKENKGGPKEDTLHFL